MVTFRTVQCHPGLSHVLGAVDKTSSSFSVHGKIGNFIIIKNLHYYFLTFGHSGAQG